MIRATLAAVLCAIALPALATAEETTQAAAPQRAATVGYKSLDLTNDRDAGIMLQRLRRAANAVCDAPEINRPSPATRRAMEACRVEALATAVRLLDAPNVTRLYAVGAPEAAAFTR